MVQKIIIQSIALSALLIVSSCATQPTINPTQGSTKPVTSETLYKPSHKPSQSIDAQSAHYFTASEIKDIRSAFKPGSCDLTALNKQSDKFNLSPTWVNLYERTPQPLSKLTDKEACFLAQSDEVFAYTDDFYTESASSLGKTWFKNAIANDAKVITMRFLTPTALIEKCDPELGRPIIIDYEKDKQGKITRTIFVNEDFDMNCVK